MWWYLLPVGVAAGTAVYSVVRNADKNRKTRSATGGHADLPDPDSVEPAPPDFWSYVLRWSKIFEDAEQPLPVLPPPADWVPAEPEPPAIITPTRLTLVTAIGVGGATIWTGTTEYFAASAVQIILLGALVGIGTNWLAIKMLFRPLEPRFGIQGVIPANRDRIIDALSRGVARNLLDRETIRAAVHESDLVRGSIDELVVGLKRLVESERFRRDVSEAVRDAVVAFVKNSRFRHSVMEAVARIGQLLPSQLGPMPKVIEKALNGIFERIIKDRGDDIIDNIERNVQMSVRHIGDQTIAWLESLPEGFEERRAEIEAVITDSVARRAAAFDIEGIVRSKLEAYSPADLEKLLLSATDTHLSKIQYFGWFLGALAAPAVKGFEHLVILLAR